MVCRKFFLVTFFVLPALGAQYIQIPDLKVPSSARAHRDDVEKMFVDGYTAYKKHAFGHDDFAPEGNSFKDSRNGWGSTIVDAMSTMVPYFLVVTNRVSQLSLSDLSKLKVHDKDLFEEAVDFAGKIDFSRSKTGGTVSLFESTIRYLGGFISAYELSGKKHTVLIDKAKQLADKLSYAWSGNNVIPHSWLNFDNNSPSHGGSNIAEAGTLVLEWSSLSKYSGNGTYRDLAEKAFRRIGSNKSPLPGLPAQDIDPSSGNAIGNFVSWGGCSDSYYEYLIKYPRLTNTDDQYFTDMWKLAVDSSINTLLKTSTVGNHVYLGEYNSGAVIHKSSHLACFHGGNWIMGGKLIGNDTIVKHGLALADACWNTYSSTATGIGPEEFHFIANEGEFIPESSRDFYNQHGFWIGRSEYILRPEVLETNFYAWRATGDTKYLDRAAKAIESFKKALPFGEGFGGLENVNDVNSSKINDMESFWFAETLKYLYLTFDDPSHISLDKYVFNTEAHPFEAPAPLERYGTSRTPVLIVGSAGVAFFTPRPDKSKLVKRRRP